MALVVQSAFAKAMADKLKTNTHIHQNPPQFPPVIKRRSIILNQILFLIGKIFCDDPNFSK